jgi:hypothetical protein
MSSATAIFTYNSSYPKLCTFGASSSGGITTLATPLFMDKLQVIRIA